MCGTCCNKKQIGFLLRSGDNGLVYRLKLIVVMDSVQEAAWWQLETNGFQTDRIN